MDWLPGAIRDIRGGFPWQVACPYKGILHTTEGPSWPDYPPRYHPNATIRPTPGQGIEIRQHASLNEATYALAHTTGAPTNGAHAIQFELVGTCDPSGPRGAYYWPDADDTVLLDLYRKVIKPVSDAYRIKLTAPTFKAYPASYGPGNGVRFASDAAWLAWNGWAGHQHVRGGNDHGDPGAFPWGRLMRLATHPEDNMPLTPDDAALVARAVHNQRLGGSDITIGVALQNLYGRPTAAAVTADLAAAIVPALTPSLVAAIKALPASTATVDDATITRIAAATATATVNELNTRLVR